MKRGNRGWLGTRLAEPPGLQSPRSSNNWRLAAARPQPPHITRSQISIGSTLRTVARINTNASTWNELLKANVIG